MTHPSGTDGHHDFGDAFDGLEPETTRALTHLAGELCERFPDVDPREIAETTGESYDLLAAPSRSREELVRLTGIFTRERLADRHRDPEDHRTRVLFVCRPGAGRSQIAAALTTVLSDGQVVAACAGSRPVEGLHPYVREILEEFEGEKALDRFPKPLTEEMIRHSDMVVTAGSDVEMPVHPGVVYEEWPVADPSGATREGIARIRDDIERRVRALLSRLNAQEPEAPLSW